MVNNRARGVWAMRTTVAALVFLVAGVSGCGQRAHGYRETPFYSSVVELSFRYGAVFDRITSQTDLVRRELSVGTPSAVIEKRLVGCSPDFIFPSLDARVEETRKLLASVQTIGPHAVLVRRHLEGVLTDAETLRRQIGVNWSDTAGLKISPGERCLGASHLNGLKTGIEEHFLAILLLK